MVWALDAYNGIPLTDASTLATRLSNLGEMRRRLEQAERVIEACKANDLEASRGLSAALSRDFESATLVDTLTFAKVTERTIEAFVDAGSQSGKAITLGTPSIDRNWRPYPGSLTTIGAQTGVGKSTVMTAWAISMGQRGIPNGVVSAEDPAEDFGAKWLGELAPVDPSRLWRGDANATEMGRVIAAAQRYNALPISFAHIITRKLDDVLAAMRRLKAKHGARVIAVDYLQNIRPRIAARDPRYAIDEVLAELIIEAASLDVALVLASQISRESTKDGKEPSVNALKESGTIENRSQAIVMLWRDDPAATTVHAKLAKVKRVPSGIRFDLVRNTTTGQLVETEFDGGSDDDWHGR
jgi:replicative DNA helicase